MLPLRVSGDLSDVDPALLIRSLSRSRETGRLAVTDGEVTRNLFFKAGDLLFATSSDADEGLGACLVRGGLLGLDELAQAASGVTPERRLGAVLIDDGRLGPEELVEAVSSQILEIVYAVLGLSRGRYLFDFSDLALREMIVLRRDPRSILLNGLRRVQSVTRVNRGLKQLQGRPWRKALPESWAALDLTPDEQQVLELLPTPWTGTPLPESAELKGWPVARAIWAFTLVGLIVPISTRLPTPVPQAPEGAGRRPAQAQGPPGDLAPETIDAEGLQALLRTFNEKQHYLYRLLKVEIGAGADVFLRSCLKKLPAAAAAVFEGAAYSPAGRWEDAVLGPRLAVLDFSTAAARLESAIAAQVEEIARTVDEERATAIQRDLAALVRPSNDGRQETVPRLDAQGAHALD